jgi:hypothetical protein
MHIYNGVMGNTNKENNRAYCHIASSSSYPNKHKYCDLCSPTIPFPIQTITVGFGFAPNQLSHVYT